MKKYFFVHFIFFAPLVAVSAQPIVTSSNFPPPGTRVNYKEVVLLSYPPDMEIQDTGLTWAFTDTLSTSSPLWYDYVTPAVTPASIYYPGSNLAAEPSTNIGDYEFYSLTSNALEFLGNNGTYGSNHFPFQFTAGNSMVRYSLPMHFNDTMFDTFSFSSMLIDGTDTVTGYYFGDYGYRVYSSGTLITPYATYPQTLFVIALTNIVDSTIYTGQYDTVLVNRGTSSRYSFISADAGDYSEQFYFSSTINTRFQVGISSIPNSVNEINKITASLTVYPVPASDCVTLNFNDPGTGNGQLEIYDNTGKLIQRNPVNVSGKTNILSWKIDISGYPQGIYFARLLSGTNHSETRFIKQ